MENVNVLLVEEVDVGGTEGISVECWVSLHKPWRARSQYNEKRFVISQTPEVIVIRNRRDLVFKLILRHGRRKSPDNNFGWRRKFLFLRIIFLWFRPSLG